jgi:hypothetical protein
LDFGFDANREDVRVQVERQLAITGRPSLLGVDYNAPRSRKDVSSRRRWLVEIDDDLIGFRLDDDSLLEQ